MKRIVTLSLLMFALAFGARSQSTIFNNPDNHSYWGIRVAYDHTFPTSWHLDNIGIKMFTSGPGISIGAIYNLPLVDNLYFEPGLSFYYDTYKYDDLTILGADEPSIFNPTIQKTGLRIPLTVGYHFDFYDRGKISVFTGPEVAIGFTAYEKFTEDDSDGKFTYKENMYDSETGYLRRYDVAWRIGAGISAGAWQLELAGAFGLVDLNRDDFSFKENRLTLSIGYNF